MSNTVNVDPAAIAGEVERALAGAAILGPVATPAGEAGAPALPGEPMPTPDSWRPLIAGLTPMARIALFQQWKIAPEHESEFIESLSLSLDLIFPGGLGGKWAPVVRLLAVSGVIVVTNYMANGNELPGLGPKKPPKADAKPAADTEFRRAA